MPNFRAAIGHGPFVHVKRANPVTLLGQTVGLTIGSSSAFTYTPTHYVAPFASVGAANDYTDLGQPAYDASVSSGTPTTLGTAMAHAVGGNKVRCSPGVYVGNLTGSRNTPSFRPSGIGTSVNPIIFFAQYPAAYNWGSTSLYSEIRRPGALSGTLCPAMGAVSGSNYVFFDGFYGDEEQTLSAPNRGLFYAGGGVTGVQYRRCAFTRGGDYTGTSGHNPNAIYFEGTVNSVVTDCYFSGRVRVYPSNLRQTGNIEVYNSDGYLLQYNTHDGNYTGQYIKENDDPTYSTDGRMCYNRFLNVQRGLLQQQGVANEIDHNLVYLCNASDAFAAIDLIGGPPRPNKDYNIHHNTLVVGGPASGWDINSSEIVTSEFKNNIVYAESGHTGRMVLFSGTISLWDWADWELDNNCYYSVGGTYTFSSLPAGAAISGIAAWRTETGDEANSITSDPLFVNASTHDYRLQSGSPAAGKGCFETGSEEIGMRANPSY